MRYQFVQYNKSDIFEFVHYNNSGTLVWFCNDYVISIPQLLDGLQKGFWRSKSLLVDTNKNRRQFVNITLATIIRTYHLAFQNNFTCLPNVLTNLIA